MPNRLLKNKKTFFGLLVVTMFSMVAMPILAQTNWSGPITTPTDGNRPEPINAGGATQAKYGTLLLSSDVKNSNRPMLMIGNTYDENGDNTRLTTFRVNNAQENNTTINWILPENAGKENQVLGVYTMGYDATTGVSTVTLEWRDIYNSNETADADFGYYSTPPLYASTTTFSNFYTTFPTANLGTYNPGNKITNGGRGDVYIGNKLEVDGRSYFDGGVSVDGFTNGSLIFQNSAGVLAQNNAKLFWDDGFGRLGLNTNMPVDFLLDANGDVGPHTTNTYDLGSPSKYWRNIYATNLFGTLTIPGFTKGSVIFQGDTALSQDNANFFWNATTKRLGIGTATPNKQLHIYSTSGNGNAEIDIQSTPGAGSHWGIYHDGGTDELRLWNDSDRVAFTNLGVMSAGTVPWARIPATSCAAGTFARSTNGSGFVCATDQTMPNGTTDGQTLHYTGGTWVIDQNIYNNGGNIGIGTNVPGTYKLNVAGNTNITGTANVTSNLTVGGTTYSTGNLYSGGDIYTTGVGDDLWLGTATQTSANFRAYATGEVHIDADSIPLTFGESQNAKILYDGTNLVLNPRAVGSGSTIFSAGNVGVGVSTPTNKFQIGTNPANYSTNDFLASNANGSIAINNNVGSSYIYSSQRLDLLSAGKGLSIATDGNVGLGTITPSFKLQSAGDVGPNADITYNLGSSTLRWKNIYAQTFVGEFNPNFKKGSVVFMGTTTLAEDNGNFFWDNENKRLSIGATSTEAKLGVYSEARPGGWGLYEVTGSGNTVVGEARFNEEFSPGDKIIINNQERTVVNVIDYANIEVTPAWDGIVTGLYQVRTKAFFVKDGDNDNTASTLANGIYLGGIFEPSEDPLSNGGPDSYAGLLSSHLFRIFLGGKIFAHNENSILNPGEFNNLYFGSESGQGVIGTFNTALGYGVMSKSSGEGHNNTAFGALALAGSGSIFGSNSNSAFGSQALSNNTIGYGNIAFGYNTMNLNKEGNNNVAIGTEALYGNQYSDNNIAIGQNALYSNNRDATDYTDGNVAIGSAAGKNNTKGGKNIFIGMNAGLNNDGSSNIFLGHETGKDYLGDSTLIINNEATTDDSSNALIFGKFADSGSSLIRFNANAIQVNTTKLLINDTATTYKKGKTEQVCVTTGEDSNAKYIMFWVKGVYVCGYTSALSNCVGSLAECCTAQPGGCQ